MATRVTTPIELAISATRTEMNWHRTELVSNLDQVQRIAKTMQWREDNGTTTEELNLAKFAAAAERHSAAVSVLRDQLRTLEAIRDAK